MKRKLMKLEEGETAKLIRMSDRNRYVSLAFGPGGVYLDEDQAPWAAKLVREWRAGDPERV